jgi:hypothetical protein
LCGGCFLERLRPHGQSVKPIQTLAIRHLPQALDY